MPVDFKRIPETQTVFTHIHGPVNQQELLDHSESMKALFASGELDTQWMQIIHYDEVTYSGKPPLLMVRLLAKTNPWPVECPRVIVTGNKLIFGLARMYQQLADPDQKGIQVMMKVEDAEEFLQACREKKQGLNS